MTEISDKSKEPKEIRFTPTPRVWAYLQWLTEHTMLGKTPGDVAQLILLQRLSEMRGEDYKVDKI
jgi:hypothetical protein